jgi:hypothetical protein
MRVMVLTDASFAPREHQLLTRLEIGLADEGAGVVHAVPARCPVDVANAFSSTIVRYDDGFTPLGILSRARQLLLSVSEELDTPEAKIDLVHVFGRRAWGLGTGVARETGATLVLEVWRADLATPALHHARSSGCPCGLITSSERIAESLRAAGRGGGAPPHVGVAPWGVPAPESTRPISALDRTRGVALSIVAEAATGAGVAEVRALLEGVQRAARRLENLLVFLDGAAADRSAIWRAARRLRLLDRVTSVADLEARREPILQTDMLAVPEPNGVCRTLLLSAMAENVSIIARRDPVHETWLNQRTARIIGTSGPATPEEWENAIVACVENEEETATIRSAARDMVRADRTVAAYVELVRRFYDELAPATPSPSTAGVA